MTSLSTDQVWERFSYGIQRLFKSWTALQIAVEQSCGGNRSAAKAVDLHWDIIAFFRAKHGRVNHDELEDLLLDELDDKFNLEVDDGSVKEVSAIIITFFALLEKGDVAKFDQELTRIPSNAATTSSVRAPEAEEIVMDDAEMLSEGIEDMVIESGDAQMVEQQPESSSSNSSSQRQRNQPDEDGWTVVAGNGKRRTKP